MLFFYLNGRGSDLFCIFKFFCIKNSVLGNCKMLDLLIISIYNKALYSKFHGKKPEKSSFLFYRPSKPIQTTFNTREQTFYLIYCPAL